MEDDKWRLARIERLLEDAEISAAVVKSVVVGIGLGLALAAFASVKIAAGAGIAITALLLFTQLRGK